LCMQFSLHTGNVGAATAAAAESRNVCRTLSRLPTYDVKGKPGPANLSGKSKVLGPVK
jgi:hypothetical protein